jgi:methionyl-tRNA formyltransferase
MKVELYAHGWVGAGVAAALYLAPDVEVRQLVTYDPDVAAQDDHPCPALNEIASAAGWTQCGPNAVYVTSANTDAVITANWRHVLDPIAYARARLGAINVHNGLLPKYPGTRPLQRSLEAKDKVLGYSIHRITEECDQGDVLFQRRILRPLGKVTEHTVNRLYETFGFMVGHDVLHVLRNLL